jgi:hypothetical protein
LEEKTLSKSETHPIGLADIAMAGESAAWLFSFLFFWAQELNDSKKKMKRYEKENRVIPICVFIYLKFPMIYG